MTAIIAIFAATDHVLVNFGRRGPNVAPQAPRAEDDSTVSVGTHDGIAPIKVAKGGTARRTRRGKELRQVMEVVVEGDTERLMERLR